MENILLILQVCNIKALLSEVQVWSWRSIDTFMIDCQLYIMKISFISEFFYLQLQKLKFTKEFFLIYSFMLWQLLLHFSKASFANQKLSIFHIVSSEGHLKWTISSFLITNRLVTLRGYLKHENMPSTAS